MIHKDSILFGLLFGFAIPFVGFALFLELYDQLESAAIISDIGFSETFRKRTISLLAICLNLLPFMLYSGRHYYNSMRGVVFPTVIYVIIWLLYFGSSML